MPGDRAILTATGSCRSRRELPAGENPAEVVVRGVPKEPEPSDEVGFYPSPDLLPLPERRVLVLAWGCSVEKIGRVAYGAERVALGSLGVDMLKRSICSRGMRGWCGPGPQCLELTVPDSDDA